MTFVRIGLWHSGKLFLKEHSYSGHFKNRPSGSALPTVSLTLPPSSSASSEAGRPAPPPRPPTPPSEGRGRRASLALAVSSSQHTHTHTHPAVVRWERRGRGGAVGVVAFGGECDLVVSSLQGFGGSRALSLSGVICACSLCPFLGRHFCLCRA